MDELDARVEAEVGGARRLGQVARDLGRRATGRSPAGSAASCRSPRGGGASRSRSSSRSRPRRAGSGCAAGRAGSAPRRRTAGRAARRRRCPAEPRITIARIEGACPQAPSSCSEPITLMSCIVRADMPGARLADDRVVDDRVDLRARDQRGDSGSRMSAWINSVRRERLCAAPRVEARRRASNVRVALEPAREERPEVAPDAGDQHPAAGHYLDEDCLRRGRRGARARLAGRRSSIASRRRPIVRSSAFSSRMSSWVAGRRSSIARRRAAWRARPRRPCGGRPRTRPCRRSRPGCGRAGARRSPAWPARSARPPRAGSAGVAGAFRHASSQSRVPRLDARSTRSGAIHLKPADRARRAGAPAGRPAPGAGGGPAPARRAEDVQPQPRALGLHRDRAPTASRSPCSPPAWAARARRSSPRS